MQNTTRNSKKRTNVLLESEIKTIDAILDSKAKYRKVVQAAIGQWVKDFQAGVIKISSVEDLKKLVEMDISLQIDGSNLTKMKNKKLRSLTDSEK